MLLITTRTVDELAQSLIQTHHNSVTIHLFSDLNSMLLYLSIYAFFGLATTLAELSRPGKDPLIVKVLASSIIGLVWPLFLATKLIHKIVL